MAELARPQYKLPIKAHNSVEDARKHWRADGAFTDTQRQCLGVIDNNNISPFTAAHCCIEYMLAKPEWKGCTATHSTLLYPNGWPFICRLLAYWCGVEEPSMHFTLPDLMELAQKPQCAGKLCMDESVWVDGERHIRFVFFADWGWLSIDHRPDSKHHNSALFIDWICLRYPPQAVRNLANYPH